MYFSMATLTTVGYGDIAPVHPVARSLANMEGLFGQLYPAIILARVMGLYQTRRCVRASCHQGCKKTLTLPR